MSPYSSIFLSLNLKSATIGYNSLLYSKLNGLLGSVKLLFCFLRVKHEHQENKKGVN